MTNEPNPSGKDRERPELKLVEQLLYKECGLQLTNLKSKLIDQGYGACSFELNNKVIEYKDRDKDKSGQFIFPKAILADQGIMSKPGKIGKRGIRVYPPWDEPTNVHAQKTQNWQVRYFLTIDPDNSNYIISAMGLFQELSVLNN